MSQLEHRAYLILWIDPHGTKTDEKPTIVDVGIYPEPSPTINMLLVPATIRITSSFASYADAEKRMINELRWALDHRGTSPLMEWAAEKILEPK